MDVPSMASTREGGTPDGLVATIDDVRFDDSGLVPTIVIAHDDRDVLMMAWMNRASLEATMDTGETVFWSRSRQQLWPKGATSGNRQRVVSIALDCDGDALLIEVDQGGDGVACHTGQRTCFHRLIAFEAEGVMSAPSPAGDEPA